MFISLWIGYQRLMETFTLYSYQRNYKIICICTFSINANMQFRKNNKRFNRTSYLYYTHFLLNIYWHFIQKTDKIPKTYMFWGLKYAICHLLLNCGARRAAFKPYFFLSFIRGSRVKYPALFKAGR